MRYFFLLFISFVFCFGEIKSFDDVKAFINDGVDKGYFPKTIISVNGPKARLKDINLDFRRVIFWDINSQCDQHQNEVIIANKKENNSIMCPGNDNIYILNSGNNTVEDPWGDDIFVMGRGDDVIKKSGDVSIFIFEKGWGNDELIISDAFFRHFNFNKYEMKGYDGSFPYTYASFIIFGDGIKRDDLAWSGDTLINLKTNDTIKFSDSKNVNFLFKDEPVKLVDLNFIKTKNRPYDINLTNKNINDYISNKEFGYIVGGIDSFKKVKLIPNNQAKIYDEIYLREYINEVKFSNDLIFISENGQNYGYLNIYDKNLNLLDRIVFHGSILGTEIYKNYLYLLQDFTNYSDMSQNENSIFIYKILDNSVKFIDRIKTNNLTSIKIVDDNIFAFKFLKGFTTYSLKDPMSPLKVDIKGFDDYIVSIEKYKDFMVIYSEKGLLQKFELINNNLIEKQSLNLGEDVDIRGQSKNAMFILENKIFLAAGNAGVFVVDLDKFEVIDRIKSDEYVSQIIHINDILLVKNNSSIIELKKYFPNFKFKEIKPQEIKEKITPKKVLSKDEIQTLLYKTAYSNSKEDAMKYCKMGGDPHFLGHETHTPMEMASRLGSIDALTSMLKCSGKVTDSVMMIAVFGTTHEDEVMFELITLLEKYGGNFKAKSGDGCSMLHYAATNGSLRTIKYIASKGADPKAICRNEKPSQWANKNKDKRVKKFLEELEQ